MDAPQKPPEMTGCWWEKEKEPVNHLNAFGILERWLLVGVHADDGFQERGDSGVGD